MPESAEDVFSLFSPADVRRARDASFANIEALLTSIISRLITLRHLPAFPDPELAPAKETLNCIRILTRVLPFLYEADALQPWEDRFFWQRRKCQRTTSSQGKPEVLFDGSKSEAVEKPSDEGEDTTEETIKPLGEELIDTLVDLLFYTDFTIPRLERSKDKVTYAIWQNGVGCNTSMQSTRDMENNRTEILRLLLTLSSRSLYMPAHTIPVEGVKALTYITTCPDKQIVLSLLCSQLNTVRSDIPSLSSMLTWNRLFSTTHQLGVFPMTTWFTRIQSRSMCRIACNFSSSFSCTQSLMMAEKLPQRTAFGIFSAGYIVHRISSSWWMEC